MPAVRPEFGPTLPELLGPRLRALPRALRLAVYAVGAVLAAVAMWALLLRGDETLRGVVVRDPVAYNYVFREPLARFRPPPGATSRVAAPGQSFTVRTLRLRPYTGDSAGVLPVLASQLADRMARTYDGFLVRQEGRANVNRQQGYEIVFQYRSRGRTAYGRRVLLLPSPTERDGADITMLSERSAAVPRADAVGRSGALKTSLRSFRFGTDRP